MKKTKFAFVLSLAALLGLLSSPAFAYSSAMASIDLNYELVDLDPEDGITPSVTFISSNYSNVNGYAHDSSTGNYPTFNTSVAYSDIFSAFAPVSGIAGAGGTNASASIGASQVNLQGYAIGHDDNNISTFYTSASPLTTSQAGLFDSNSFSYFTITPETSISFTGNMIVSAMSSIGSNSKPEESSAYVNMRSEIYNGTDYYDRELTSSLIYSKNGHQQITYYRYKETGPPQSGDFDGTSFSSYYGAGLENNTPGQAYGYIAFNAGVRGSSYSSVSPVPESQTYEMLMAGLGVLGFIGRRKLKINQN